MNKTEPRRAGLALTLMMGIAMLGACGSEQTETNETGVAAGSDATPDDNSAMTVDPGERFAPSKPVVAQQMAYTEYDDQLVYGYFSAPDDMFEPLPAVIMIHEWWGLNDTVRLMADRLAGEGYIVFAVDLFGGQTAGTPGEARALMMDAIEDPDSIRENLKAALEFVGNIAGAPRVGSIGWSFGGGVSLSAAQMFPTELDATVIYYGQVTNDEDALRPIGAPVLGLFGAQDAGIKAKAVEDFRAALGRLRKNYDVHIYPGVGHAFANPDDENYDAAVAEDAWQRTVKFLNLHLAIRRTEP